MASTTETFLKSRVNTPTVNKWSSGFTTVQKYAEKNNLPLIGCWSNGDACGNCINFEKTLMTSEFLNWQKTSGCVFWFGCSSDKTTDDKLQGTGSKWCKNSILLSYRANVVLVVHSELFKIFGVHPNHITFVVAVR